MSAPLYSAQSVTITRFPAKRFDISLSLSNWASRLHRRAWRPSTPPIAAALLPPAAKPARQTTTRSGQAGSASRSALFRGHFFSNHAIGQCSDLFDIKFDYVAMLEEVVDLQTGAAAV